MILRSFHAEIRLQVGRADAHSGTPVRIFFEEKSTMGVIKFLGLIK